MCGSPYGICISLEDSNKYVIQTRCDWHKNGYIITYSTNRRQGKCVLRVCVAFACKRVALLFTACERVCLDVLTHTFVFYHTIVTACYLQELTYMDCTETSKPGHCQY